MLGTDDRSTRPSFIALMVFLAAIAIYIPSFNAELQLIDDPQYITTNPYVLYPSWQKLGWFFAEVRQPSTVLGYYQPLTMASLMLDRVIEGWLSGGYGPRPDPFVFHLTNILLHGANSAMVFVLAMGLTRQRRLGLFCGLLFALHPLNVETVAWVCQRKALLATFFSLLMFLAYARYVQTRQRSWWIAVHGAFLAAMLAKPTALPVPAVLLLADVWPFRRFSRSSVIEKLPLIALATIGAYVAYLSQATTVSMTIGGEHRRPIVTILIACHNLVFYLMKFIMPFDLCPRYPMPNEVDIMPDRQAFLLGWLGTIVFAVAVFWSIRRRWFAFWTMSISFLLLIAPTLTPVRFMDTIAADRFMYLPMIPLLLLLTKALGTWIKHRDALQPESSRRGRLSAIFGLVILAAFAFQTVRQQAVWQDAFSYYQAAFTRFPDSPGGHYGMGNAWLDKYHRLIARSDGASDAEARACLDQSAEAYRRALKIDSRFSWAWYRLGHVLVLEGRLQDGISAIQNGLNLPDADPEGNLFLGLAYSHAGDYEQAISPYETCLQRQPSNCMVLKNLANALLRTGRAADALPHFERLYLLDPTDLDGRQNWGVALITVGRASEAVAQLRSVVDIRAELTKHESDPSRREQASARLADARFTLAGALAIAGADNEALAELTAAIELNPALQSQALNHPAFRRLHDSTQWQRLFPQGAIPTSSDTDPGT